LRTRPQIAEVLAGALAGGNDRSCGTSRGGVGYRHLAAHSQRAGNLDDGPYTSGGLGPTKDPKIRRIVRRFVMRGLGGRAVGVLLHIERTHWNGTGSSQTLHSCCRRASQAAVRHGSWNQPA
jgi:hypothetical protein